MTEQRYITEPGDVNWRQMATDVTMPTSPFIAGRFVESVGDQAYECVNPANGKSLGAFEAGHVEDVDRAAHAARQAADAGGWRYTSPAERKSVLIRLAAAIREHAIEFAVMDTLQIGKTVRHSLADAHWAAKFFEYYAEAVDKIYDSAIPTNPFSIAITQRIPHGVVGAIVPWNFPIVNAAIKLAPALAAGNCVVLKPSELSPSSALHLASIASEAGLPDGVLNVVPGLGETVGAALVRHRNVDMVTFTGSTATGQKLVQMAGTENLKPVMVECGGKSPHIVLPDVCDLERVADIIAGDIFWNQGQVCSAGSRLVVHQSLAPALIDLLKTRAAAIVPGDPLDPDCTFGPVVSQGQLEKIKRHVADAMADGGYVVAGGSACLEKTGGYYFEPTIFAGIPSGSSLAAEEVFGPVLAVLTFETPEEAVRIANETSYGLAATVWTRDTGLGNIMASRISAGVVTVRDDRSTGTGGGMMLASEPVKFSGFGAQGGVHGIHPYTRLKGVQHLVASTYTEGREG